MRLPPLVSSMLLLAALCGCTTVKQTMPQHTNAEIWAAMVDVANHPNYDDPNISKRWIVRENKVWADEEEGRIEIYRRLERDVHRPLSVEAYEEREWRFEVTLDRSEVPEDRKVKFVSRGPAVPAHAKYEADRYYNQLWATLGGKPAAMLAEEAAATQPGPVTTQHAPPMESSGR